MRQRQSGLEVSDNLIGGIAQIGQLRLACRART
jgi:hypothetical protein